LKETLPLLKAAGIEVLEDPEKSRKLILNTNLPDVRVLVVRATDVPAPPGPGSLGRCTIQHAVRGAGAPPARSDRRATTALRLTRRIKSQSVLPIWTRRAKWEGQNICCSSYWTACRVMSLTHS
jgi:hypothetical protein